MSKKTLQFNNIRLKKEEFHKSKQPIDLMSVNVDQIVVIIVVSALSVPLLFQFLQQFYD